MSDAWRYAVWLDPRSRSRAIESRKFGYFQTLSPPTFITGADKWPLILKLAHNTVSLSGPDFSFLSYFLCHVTLTLAVSRSRPSVPYGSNLFFIPSLPDGVGKDILCFYAVFFVHLSDVIFFTTVSHEQIEQFW